LLSAAERREYANKKVAEIIQQARGATQNTKASVVPEARQNQRDSVGILVDDLGSDAGMARNKRKEKGSNSLLLPTVLPCSEAVDSNALLHEIHATVKRFIVCSNETAITATLWIAFTWFIDVAEVAPLAFISSTEMECGKSQVLDLIGRLSRRPLVTSNISIAAVYRAIEAHHPTLLIDEADSFVKGNEALRGIVDSGHTRQSAYVIRTGGNDHTLLRFSTWGAKAIAGIGRLSPTMMGRAVHLQIRRKSPSEIVERLRHADPSLFERLASMLARFAQDAAPAIRQARPQLPEALNDRAQDNWEPLLSIADYAGAEWPRIARDAALKVSCAEPVATSLSKELLEDIRIIWNSSHSSRMSSFDLIKVLIRDKQKPWATYNEGKPILPRQLAKLLGEYGIHPHSIRMGPDTCKGYKRSSFSDVFLCYFAIPDAIDDV
jgi:putative DNA primase/helicase